MLDQPMFWRLKGLEFGRQGGDRATVSAEGLAAFHWEPIYGCDCLMGHFLVSLCDDDCGLSTTSKG